MYQVFPSMDGTRIHGWTVTRRDILTKERHSVAWFKSYCDAIEFWRKIANRDAKKPEQNQ